MALVICDMSPSLEGYVTGPNDSRENPFGDGAGMLHDWIFGGTTDHQVEALARSSPGAGNVSTGFLIDGRPERVQRVGQKLR
jgi:hypothetical protein